MAKHFTQSQLEAIAGAMGDTNDGLTGSEIAHLLASCKMKDPDPALTKRHRLYNALALSQNERQDRLAVLAFSPARLRELSAIARRTKDYEFWHTVWLEVAQRPKPKSAGRTRHPTTMGRSSIFPPEMLVTSSTTISHATGRGPCKASPDMSVSPYLTLAVTCRVSAFRRNARSLRRSYFTAATILSWKSFTPSCFLSPTLASPSSPSMVPGKAVPCDKAFIWITPGRSRPRQCLTLHLDAVDWLGASCGGYMSIRAAAFEPRIKHIISMPTTYSGLDMTLKQMRPGKAQKLVSMFNAGDRQGTEAVVDEERLPSSIFEWCVVQGMHITGTKTPFDFLTAIAQQSLDGILHNVRQDILLTEGEQDHLFNVEWLYRTMRELICARSVTARIFTAREGAEQHCQLGNSAVARQEIVRWLGSFYPGMPIARG